MTETHATTQWLYRIQVTRPDWHTTGPTQQEEDVLSEHVEYLQRLTDDGVVILAGPTTNDDETRFGIVVFNAASENEARQIMEIDPAVKTGLMRAELFPFFVALLSKQKS